jgi:hypothetical protein
VRTTTAAAVQHGDPLEKLVSFWCMRIYTLSCGHIKCPSLFSDGVVLLNDNAWLHMVHKTQDLLQNFRLATLYYHLYRPDLGPSHFHLFPVFKEYLSGYCFTCDEDIKHATITWLTQQGHIFLCIQDRQTYHMLWKVSQLSRGLRWQIMYQ